jgi:DNA (cytosine-5)-methyltransferase 1
MDGKPNLPRPKQVKNRTVHAVDLFCGAGGTSSGLIQAVNSMGMDIKLVAINHWDVAIATHSRNHEEVEHYCQSIETLDPLKIVPGGRLQLLVASPECIHHSNARGGKPRSDQKRADAWMLMRWIDKLYVENILIENVPEFRDWGPLTASGRPDKRHKGKYFKQFIDSLSINYNVEYDILNCADYGDPTTRKRLFILARRGHKKIVWPARTHASRNELAQLAVNPEKFGVRAEEMKKLQPWVPARKIIDWSIEGTSVFGRKKDLSPNTMRRIFAGLWKYSLAPFIVPQFTGPDTRDVNEPLGTVTTTSRGVGVAEPFMVNLKNADRRDRDINEPTFTQAAGGNHQAVAEPFIVPFFGEREGQEPRTRDIEEPAPTVTGHGRMGVAEPFVISAGGPELDAKSVDEPMRTVLTRDHQAVVEPFTLTVDQPMTNRSKPRGVDEPVPTVTTDGAIGLVEADPFLIKNFSGSDASRAKSVDDTLGTVAANFNHHYLVEPLLVNMKGKSGSRSVDDPTFGQTTKEHQALAQAFIVKFYGNGENADSAEDPLATVTAKDRFGLVEPAIADGKTGYQPKPGEMGLYLPWLNIIVFIRFRMLQPHELAAAMSFPPSYEFTGNRENKVKQIGNAVPLRTSKALCGALLGK